MEESNTFRVGLCMAGAISAGAYTAGVMDYLVEALEEWERQKASGKANVPSHKVEIPVIGGASAGGMTGVILASALHDEFEPVKTASSKILDPIPHNKLYHSWVDLVADDMLEVLLNTNDIKKNKVESVLNSDFIKDIADRAVEVTGEKCFPRPYIAKKMKVFVTLSNLEGMDFDVSFNSNSSAGSEYIVSNHRDYACFRLADSEEDYSKDGWIPLNFKKQLNVEVVKNAAMATGAFPIGLKARKVVRDGKYLNDLDWFDYITKDAKKPFSEKEPYESVNIDGGVINNEPFENVRQILKNLTKQRKASDYQNFDEFKSTVLMIDPFPSKTVDFNSRTDLKSVIGNALGALIDQSRVKPNNLIDIKGSNKAGQFLIKPVRFEHRGHGDKKKRIEGDLAVACGSLGGFGGFIKKEFRVHDYFLGRGNCEKFLRDYFTVPIDTKNPIFVDGYAHVEDKKTFMTANKEGGERLQIIPIFTERTKEMYMPKFENGKIWPSITESHLWGYEPQLKKRIEKVILNFTKYTWRTRLMLKLGCKVFLNRKIADTMLETISKSLKNHELLR